MYAFVDRLINVADPSLKLHTLLDSINSCWTSIIVIPPKTQPKLDKIGST